MSLSNMPPMMRSFVPSPVLPLIQSYPPKSVSLSNMPLMMRSPPMPLIPVNIPPSTNDMANKWVQNIEPGLYNIGNGAKTDGTDLHMNLNTTDTSDLGKSFTKGTEYPIYLYLIYHDSGNTIDYGIVNKYNQYCSINFKNLAGTATYWDLSDNNNIYGAVGTHSYFIYPKNVNDITNYVYNNRKKLNLVYDISGVTLYGHIPSSFDIDTSINILKNLINNYGAYTQDQISASINNLITNIQLINSKGLFIKRINMSIDTFSNKLKNIIQNKFSTLLSICATLVSKLNALTSVGGKVKKTKKSEKSRKLRKSRNKSKY